MSLDSIARGEHAADRCLKAGFGGLLSEKKETKSSRSIWVETCVKRENEGCSRYHRGGIVILGHQSRTEERRMSDHTHRIRLRKQFKGVSQNHITHSNRSEGDRIEKKHMEHYWVLVADQRKDIALKWRHQGNIWGLVTLDGVKKPKEPSVNQNRRVKAKVKLKDETKKRVTSTKDVARNGESDKKEKRKSWRRKEIRLEPSMNEGGTPYSRDRPGRKSEREQGFQ